MENGESLDEVFQKIRNFGTGKNKKTCLHETCKSCHGTGKKYDGTPCIHMISCSCSKCNPIFL